MTASRMLRFYRISALALIAVGSVMILTDLPPHTGSADGIYIYVGFFVVFLPGVGNLINSFYGEKHALLRWCVAVINIPFGFYGLVLVSEQILLTIISFPHLPVGLLFSAPLFGVFLLSIVLVRQCGKQAGEVKAEE